MISVKELASAIQQVLPNENLEEINALAKVLLGVFVDEISDNDLERIITSSITLKSLVNKLSGKDLQTSNAVVRFGSGNHFGNISFQDIAGRDLIKVTVNMYERRRGIDFRQVMVSIDESSAHLIESVVDLNDSMIKISVDIEDFNRRSRIFMQSYHQLREDEAKTRLKELINKLALAMFSFNISLDKMVKRHTQAVSMYDIALQKVLDVDFYEMKPPKNEMIRLQEKLAFVEENLVIMQRKVFEMRAQFDGLIVSKKAFELSNTAVESCKEKSAQLSALLQEDLQLVWRTTGTIHGYMRSL